MIYVDFETYYDADYSLKKLTIEEYINDPRFEIIGVAFAKDDDPPQWLSLPSIDQYKIALAGLKDHSIVCFNAMFDGAILSWRLGIKPKFMFDPMLMARALTGNLVKLSLENLAKHYAVGLEKGTEVKAALGKRRRDFDDEELHRYGEYSKTDIEITRRLFKKLVAEYPRAELHRIDMTLRMFTDPIFVLDTDKIHRELEIERTKKAQLLNKLSLENADILQSNDKFAAFLQSLGVEPPTKISEKLSKKAGREVRTWAFSKNDPDFKALLDHDDPLVVAAVEARLGHKSTQKETRAERFLGIARRMGKLPVPLAYYQAHTGRYGGADKINLQNLPAARGSTDPDVALLRKAMRAPEGYKVVVVDASQIEARIAFWGAGQQDKVEAFAQGRDVYSEQASVIFGRPIDRKKNKDDFIPGFIGKAVTLGCQYGLGHVKFGKMIYTGMLGGPRVLFDAKTLAEFGVDTREYLHWLNEKELLKNVLEDKPADVSRSAWIQHLACARHIIDTYRETNPHVVDLWRQCQRAIDAMFAGERFEFFAGGVLRTEHEAIVLPNGMRLLYKDIEKNEDGYSCLRFKEGRVQRVKLYGGGVLENCCQALAAIIVGEAMRKADAKGYKVALQVHDEVAIVVKEHEAENALNDMIRWMSTPPSWAAGLPLAAEGSFADSYGEAK